MQDNIQSFMDLKKKTFLKTNHALFIIIHKFSNQASNFNVAELKVVTHPDKTICSRISDGFVHFHDLEPSRE